jgi:hypothetical protein
MHDAEASPFRDLTCDGDEAFAPSGREPVLAGLRVDEEGLRVRQPLELSPELLGMGFDVPLARSPVLAYELEGIVMDRGQDGFGAALVAEGEGQLDPVVASSLCLGAEIGNAEAFRAPARTEEKQCHDSSFGHGEQDSIVMILP